MRLRVLGAVGGVALAVGLLAVLIVLAAQAVTGGSRTEVSLAEPTLENPVAAPGSAAAPAAAPATGGRSLVDQGWVRRTAAQAGIPEAAVRAYASAQLRVADRCNLGWTTLAGIGWVESHHGTMGDRVLMADGRSSEPILGPALDGRGDVAAIPATAASAQLHTDPDWDHAVGPLQFITDTWSRWAADGDGDGTTDPHDVDDAALAAARYLCASGADFTTGEGWSRAVFSYNHAQSYVEAVNAAARAYAERSRA